MPNYHIPEPVLFARLQKNPLLANEEQQAALAAYQTGEVGIEATVLRVLADVRQRAPDLQAERNATAAERTRRARVQREMAQNETAAGPTFVDCDEEGNPLSTGGAAGAANADDSDPDTTTKAGGGQLGQEQESEEGPELTKKAEVETYEADNDGPEDDEFIT